LYRRVVAAWEAGGRRFPEVDGARRAGAAGRAPAGNDAITVAHLIKAFWEQARQRYGPDELGIF